MLLHAPYTSEKALIYFPYLRHERLMICDLSFMNNVNDELIYVIINLIGFDVEGISYIIISQHCCGVGFGVKCWAKLAVKVSGLLLLCTFWSILSGWPGLICKTEQVRNFSESRYINLWPPQFGGYSCWTSCKYQGKDSKKLRFALDQKRVSLFVFALE